MESFRDTYWNIPGVLEYSVYAFAVLTCVNFLYGLYLRIRLWLLGPKGTSGIHIAKRLQKVWVYGVDRSSRL
jgi:hypothetical protein